MVGVWSDRSAHEPASTLRDDVVVLVVFLVVVLVDARTKSSGERVDSYLESSTRRFRRERSERRDAGEYRVVAERGDARVRRRGERVDDGYESSRNLKRVRLVSESDFPGRRGGVPGPPGRVRRAFAPPRNL